MAMADEELAQPKLGGEPEQPAWKTTARILGAEALGTGLIVIFGCGSVCCSLSDAYQGLFQVASIWGIGVALAIYLTADISGAHLNPAMTLAFLLVRPSAQNMTGKKAVMYMGAQLAGAIIAAAINLLAYDGTIKNFERRMGITRGEPNSIRSALAFGEYFPNPGMTDKYGGSAYAEDDVSMIHALFVEAWGTCVLAAVIFSVTHERNKVLGDVRSGVPACIGATVAVLLALYAPITQAGYNPARDFGPRLVAAVGGWGSVALPGPRNGFLVYIVGPLIGAPLGAVFSEWVLNQAPRKKVVEA